MESGTGRRLRSRAGVLLVISLVALGTVAVPAGAVTVEWDQDEQWPELPGAYPYEPVTDLAVADDGEFLYVARRGILVLDRSGSLVDYFGFWALRLDVAGDRLLVYGVGGLAVLDTDGNLISQVDWDGPPVRDVAISGSTAVLILAENGSRSGGDRVELLDLDSLTPLGVLASSPGDLSLYDSLGADGDVLLVATGHYYIDERGLWRLLSTSVSTYENLALVRTVTLTDPYPSKGGEGMAFEGVAPAADDGIYALNLKDLGAEGGGLRTSTAMLYDVNGDFVERVWTADGDPENEAIDVDRCFGLVGIGYLFEGRPPVHHGFKYVADDRDPPCFVDTLDNIFNNAVIWLGSQKITQGCNPPLGDLFCPDDYVTRGQMAAFLSRALGYTDDGGGGRFTDTQGHLFEKAIDKLATAGVTQGCNPPVNDHFCPDDLVTRGEMAAFLVRAMGYVDNGGGDLFIDDNGHIFENAIDKLGTARVTLGCNPPTNDRFCPDDKVTRGQMAAFLKRALG